MRNVAFALRSSVKSLIHDKLSKNVSTENVIEGECQIPNDLFGFISDLVCGPDTRRQNSSEDILTIKSICSDLIFVINKGKIRPSKHLTLGLTVKSLTNSKKLLTILNRYGHTISYNTAEEIETEITYNHTTNNSIIPPVIRTIDGLHTHVAFDNFDRFIDTCGGKDTLHDTVGIIYQTENTVITEAEQSIDYDFMDQSENNDQHPVPRKRRRFDNESPRNRTFYPKPSTSISLLPRQVISNCVNECSEARKIATRRDFVWLVSMLSNPLEPMWLGHNCQMIADDSTVQRVEYLPPINASPVTYDVVHETLNYGLSIAQKCNQQKIIVTYDLAIAKMALLIQSQERSLYDDIFVNLDGFHMQMAFFEVIGKYIDSSGLVDILINADVLAGGSV